MSLSDHLDYLWKNPPAPFNKDYKSYAKGCRDMAVKTIEEMEERKPFTSRIERAAVFKELFYQYCQDAEQETKPGSNNATRS